MFLSTLKFEQHTVHDNMPCRIINFAATGVIQGFLHACHCQRNGKLYDHAGKTIEVRRSEAAGDKGKSDTVPQLQRLFYSSTEDRNRAQIGLPPMPKPVPPPPPPSKERTQEILNDDRVKVGLT